ncbi:MAG: transposase family protein [Alteromonas stellipolaris]|uniref:hypothetical protein n=1 Tax=Alteromonas stellipolaris TaxID=233316 RepID=UPI003B8DFE7D
MLHQPVIGDVYYDQERRAFSLAYYDDLQALLKPQSHSPGDLGLLLTKDALDEEVSSGAFTPQYSAQHDIQEPSHYQKKMIDKRRPFITELQKLVNKGMKPTTRETLDELKQVVHDKHHIGINKYGHSTISKWWKAYKEADFILENSVIERKSQPKRVDEPSELFLNTFVTNHWVKSGVENVAASYRFYEKAVLETRKRNEAIALLSLSTFTRRVSVLNEFEFILNSNNYSAIKKSLRTLCKKIVTSRVLERVEMDRMSLNLALIDENGAPTGNVSIYVAIDCYSRYPVSVTFELGMSEDTEGTVRSFKRIFEKTSNKLSAHGVPAKIVVDNGSGYKSDALKQIAQRLGTELIKAPSNEPWRKPFVESFIGTLRKEFFEGSPFEGPNGEVIIGVPGYKGKRKSKTTKPPSDETIKKSARLEIKEFGDLLHDYLVDYVNQPHSGLHGKTPQQVWNESIEKQPTIPVNNEQLFIACHYREAHPKLMERGTVQVNKQVFADIRLKQCYLDAKTLNPNQDMSVVVKFDPDDARWVTVIARFDDSDKQKIIQKVENRALSEDELNDPISFDELNKETDGLPSRRDIATRKIKKLIKPKTRRQRSGKETASAKQNASKGLSVEGRINESNKRYARPLKQNRPPVNQEPIKESTETTRRVNTDLRAEQQTMKWDE